MKIFLQIIVGGVRQLWQTLNFCRRLLANLLFLGLILGLILFFLHSESPPTPETGAALMLAPRGRIVDSPPAALDWSAKLRHELGEPEEIPLQDLLDIISKAASDRNISCLLLRPDQIVSISLNQVEDLNRVLAAFRKTGKKIYAAGDNFTQKQYLLASAADEIILNPAGGVDLEGIALYRTYLHRALEKLKIDFHLFKAGNYKSAMEPFTRDDMSAAAREANRLWLDDLWSFALRTITAGRPQLSSLGITDYCENYDRHLERQQGNSARAALAAGLVDKLMTSNALEKYLAGIVGPDEKNGFRQFSSENYLPSPERSFAKSPTFEKVAIISAGGNMVPGRSAPGVIGAEDLCQELRRIRRDQGIRALVLRINSGGGSLTAAEMIRDEILGLKEAGKTVVFSMAGLAASGAYWIAADADEIWAGESTLTGSIGVFGAFPVIARGLKELGIKRDGLATTSLAGSLDPGRPLTEARARALQLTVDNGYQRFLEIVAGGRRLDPSRVRQAAEGRVFTGRQALAMGLVDHLGSLADAVAAAAARVGLSPANAVYFSQENRDWQRLKKLYRKQLQVDTSLELLACQLLQEMQLPSPSLWFSGDDPRRIYAFSPLPHNF